MLRSPSKFDNSGMQNMLFENISILTTSITVHSIQFQILDLYFAIKYWKVSFCIYLTCYGRKLEERK